MELILLIAALVILCCIFANRFSDKFGMPALILFMALGMLFGSDGIFKISFENYNLAERVCSTALIFIMFYGGFGTKWKTARPVAGKAVVISTVGVIITALLTFLFCRFALGFNAPESFIVGAVISSTDAASVFSILRSKNLSLKNGTAPILEIESGSNDPIAYMLTMIGLLFLEGSFSAGKTAYMIFAQIVYGAGVGVAAAWVSIKVLKKFKITDGLDTVFITAVALLAYSIPSIIGGNGYLSVYITGIILGNSSIKNKITMVHFFDGITGLAQIVLFFLLGLLSSPHRIPDIALSAVLIALFLTFVARPAAVFALLLPMRCGIRQCLLISWAGLRGAASIVFSIMVIAGGCALNHDLFHIVFLISLMSVAVQGALLPKISRWLDMVDDESDVRKTFNDYQESSDLTLMRFFVPQGHNWENRRVSEVNMPTDSLAVMIKRGEETLIPKGDTVIMAGDSVILSVPSYDGAEDVHLKEIVIDRSHEWNGCSIEELDLPDDILIAMIKRGDETLIPRGKTRICENDTIVMYD